MSRWYQMNIVIDNVQTDAEADRIMGACNEEWPFGNDIDYYRRAKQINGFGKGSLCGGESEEEFADRLATAILNATDGDVLIHIDQTYLEDLPYNTYDFSKDDRKRLGCERVLPEAHENSEPTEE